MLSRVRPIPPVRRCIPLHRRGRDGHQFEGRRLRAGFNQRNAAYGSSESLAAMTAPADPPPTTTKSNVSDHFAELPIVSVEVDCRFPSHEIAGLVFAILQDSALSSTGRPVFASSSGTRRGEQRWSRGGAADGGAMRRRRQRYPPRKRSLSEAAIEEQQSEGSKMDTSSTPIEVVIVGGGIAGPTAARRLAKAGAR